MERYVIRGGRAGYDRLLLLARASWPDTAALFGRAGIGAGMKCIDLGCGGGAVTFELARLVQPGGFVIGVDMDEVKLGLARKAAAERDVTNVEFAARNVRTWDEPGGYDVVYSRFLLQHLSGPVDLLRRMWAAVRPGGRLIVEDADFDGWCCHPPNEGFDFLGLFADPDKPQLQAPGLAMLLAVQHELDWEHETTFALPGHTIIDHADDRDAVE